MNKKLLSKTKESLMNHKAFMPIPQWTIKALFEHIESLEDECIALRYSSSSNEFCIEFGTEADRIRKKREE